MGASSIPDRVLARTKKSDRSLALVVLAAGKGKRLRSSNPKVLHPVCGRPILWHVLAAGVAVRPPAVSARVGRLHADRRADGDGAIRAAHGRVGSARLAGLGAILSNSGATLAWDGAAGVARATPAAELELRDARFVLGIGAGGALLTTLIPKDAVHAALDLGVIDLYLIHAPWPWDAIGSGSTWWGR